MKHDYRSDPDSDKASQFLEWLQSQTAAALSRDHGNIDAVASTVFLFVNRAYEAGLPDKLVGRMFGTCIARAGYSEEEQDAVFDLLESQAEVARAVHAPDQGADGS